MHYLGSKWFVLDFFSIATSAFDLFSAGDASDLFVLRVLRALRLAKLVRLLRASPSCVHPRATARRSMPHTSRNLPRSPALEIDGSRSVRAGGSRMILRWEKRVSINYAYLGLIQALLAIIMSCHWFACVWGLQSSFNPLSTWLGLKEFCLPLGNSSYVSRAEAEQLLLDCPTGKRCDFRSCSATECYMGTECDDPVSLYLYSLYFATVTITSVGYGDMSASRYSQAEQIITTLMVLLGGLLWASLVGTFCGLTAQLDPEQRERRNQLSTLNAFMADSGLPKFLRYRLREYVFESSHVYRGERARELIAKVSPALQGEVALTVSAHRLDTVWCAARPCTRGCMRALRACAHCRDPVWACAVRACMPGATLARAARHCMACCAVLQRTTAFDGVALLGARMSAGTFATRPWCSRSRSPPSCAPSFSLRGSTRRPA